MKTILYFSSLILLCLSCTSTVTQLESGANQKDFTKWQQEYRSRLKSELGIDRMEESLKDFVPQRTVENIEDCGSYFHGNVLLMAEPGRTVRLTAFCPKYIKDRLPLVLAIQGEKEKESEIALRALKEGYVSVILSLEDTEDTGKGVWDLSRTLDWALNSLPADGINTICTGTAECGKLVLYASSLDTRISISMPVSAFCSSLTNVAGLTAPRLFHAIGGEKDALEQLKKIYTSAGNCDGCSMYSENEPGFSFDKGAWRFVSMRLYPEKDSCAFKVSSKWDELYEVKINGEAADICKGPDFSFISCHKPVPITISIEDIGKEDRLDVSPHIRKVRINRTGTGSSLTINEQGHYIVYGPSKRKLIIFAEALPETPEGVSIQSFKGVKADGRTNITAALQKAINKNTGKTLIFSKGVYLISGLTLPSNSDLFLEEGAVIRADRDNVIYNIEGTHAFIEINKARNVKIRGAGMIDGDGKTIKRGARNRRNILATESSDILIEGVISMNPASWNTHVLGCRNVTLRNYKVLNDFNIWNTDGIDPDCTENMLVENCFAHCGDDCIAIKTTDRLGKAGNLKGVTVRGCVFTSNKAGLKVGTETCGALMSDILFENNVVVESWKPMYLNVADGAELSNVTYRNNIFERCYTGPSAYDYYDGSDITPGPPAYHFIVHKRKSDSRLGSIHDVLVEGCVYETPFPSPARSDNEYGTRLEVEFRNNKL